MVAGVTGARGEARAHGSGNLKQAPHAMIIMNRYRCERNPLLSIQRKISRCDQLHHITRRHPDSYTTGLTGLVPHAGIVVVRSVVSARRTGAALELSHRLRAGATLEVSVATNGRKGGGTGSEIVLGERLEATVPVP